MGGGGITNAQRPLVLPRHQLSRLRAGRIFGLLAVLWSVAYLVWRFGWSLRDTNSEVAWWLAVPTLTIEILGFASTLALVVVLSQRRVDRVAGEGEVDHDIAIMMSDQSLNDLRVTLVSLADQAVAPRVVVVDREQRPTVQDLASEFGADYRVNEAVETEGFGTAPLSLFRAAVAAGDAEFVFVVAAGDVVLPGAVRRLSAAVSRPSVAAVQGNVVPAPDGDMNLDKLTRRELAFERSLLNPTLGSHGVGFLHNTGVLVRRSAIQSLPLRDNAVDDSWDFTPRLATEGLRVHSDGGEPVVAEGNGARWSVADRQRRAAAAWRLLNGPNGTFRWRGGDLTLRLGSAAWAVRPLDGVRRVGIVAVVIAALLAGRAPFEMSAWPLLGLLVPAIAFGSVSVAALSLGTMRVGDRFRASVRHRGLAVGLVVAINAVLVVRGISDRFTHAMRILDPTTHIALLAVALATLAACLDSLRLLANRRYDRRANRVASTTSAVWGGASVSVLDITMLGVGLVTATCPSVGDREVLAMDVWTDSGVTSIQVPTVVRNVHQDIGGLWRVGIEFEHVEPWVMNALAEACVVGPARAAGVESSARPEPSGLDVLVAAMPDSFTSSRGALRIATLLALAGAISSIAPNDASGIDQLPIQRLVTVGAAAALALVMLVTALPIGRVSRTQHT